jgi:hypothetical protein
MTDPRIHEEDESVIEPTKARQGLLGRSVLAVLIVSITFAVGAMLVSGFISF